MMANHVDPGTTTMARLPNELCIMILENLLPDDRDLYHQSMWRMRKANKILQRMRLVCKVWDDMVRPFIFRNCVAKFTGQGDTQLLYHFLESSGSLALGKPSWVRHIWFAYGHNLDWQVTEDDSYWYTAGRTNERRFRSFKQILPRLTALCDLRINADITTNFFKAITEHHSPTLKRLAVAFGHEDLPEAIPLLNRFQALQELKLTSMFLNGDIPRIPIPGINEKLPELRSLSLVCRHGFDGLLIRFGKFDLPKLSTFDAGPNLQQSDNLGQFLTPHGTRLTTLRLRFAPQGVDLSLLRQTPNLRHFEIGWNSFEMGSNKYESGSSSESQSRTILDGLPAGVKTITVTTVRHLPVKALLNLANSIDEMIGVLPEFHLNFQIPRESRPAIFTWHDYIYRRVYKTDSWVLLHAAAEDLKRKPAVLVDDMGTSLVDAVEHYKSLKPGDVMKHWAEAKG